MIEVKLDSKAKNTVAKTLDLGGGDTKAVYPPLYQGGDTKIRIHCDKILERLIAEGAEVDTEMNDIVNNYINIAVNYSNGISAINEATIAVRSSSAAQYEVRISGFGAVETRVFTKTESSNPTFRQMLEALGTVEYISNSACNVYPLLRLCYISSKGKSALTIPLTLKEYAEMVEFNIPVTE